MLVMDNIIVNLGSITAHSGDSGCNMILGCSELNFNWLNLYLSLKKNVYRFYVCFIFLKQCMALEKYIKHILNLLK